MSIRPKVLIDCDPGHDDVLAIGVAAAHCEVVGITTVDGNSTLENTTRNALLATELFGLTDVPVHSGAGGPIDGSPGRHPTEAHGRTGLDGPTPRNPVRRVDGTDAVSFLIDTVRATEGLWLVPIGPLTNIALAVRRAPDILRRVAGISIMGGSITHGNSTATAEFNIWFDPTAAAEVFDAAGGAGTTLRMCGLDLTHQVGVDASFSEALLAHGTDTTRFCGELMAYYQGYAARIEGATGEAAKTVRAALHDPCAILAITHPDLFETRRLLVAVETTGTLTTGMTVADLRPWADPSKANVDVVVRADRDAAISVVLNALRQH